MLWTASYDETVVEDDDVGDEDDDLHSFPDSFVRVMYHCTEGASFSGSLNSS